MLHSSRMLGLLRCDGKANGKEPERQEERTLEHAELKTISQQTPVKFLRKSSELLEMRSREPEIFRFAQNDKKGAHA